MWVKICANTTFEDTELSIQLGADAVGFVFAPSKRRVTPAQVAAITARLSPASLRVERIGVFPHGSFEEIRGTVQVAGLTGVQLHNDPDLVLIARLRQAFGSAVTLTQTLHWTIDPVDRTVGPDRTAVSLAAQLGALSRQNDVDRVLIDSKVGSASGGTGTAFDWTRARELFQHRGMLPLILAGGLHPENVGKAVEQLNPFGVDVASGVEREPGMKSPERLRLFIVNSRAAGDQHTP